MMKGGKIKVLVLISLVLVIIFSLYFVVAGTGTTSDKFDVSFELSYEGISHKCIDIEIQNLQDSSDNLDLKTILNETNFDTNKVNNLKFYEFQPHESLKYNYFTQCEPYNVTNSSGTFEIENCTQILTGNYTEEVWDWKDKLLIQTDKEGETELRNTWEQVAIQQFGNVKDTKKFRICFDAPIIETEDGWGNKGTIYLDLNNELFYDKTHSSWWNEAWENDDDPAHNTNMRVQDNPPLADVFQRLVGTQDKVLGSAVLTDLP